MRIEDAANARARSSAKAEIFPTFTLVRRPRRPSMKSGSTPNWVIVGPRLISTTRAGAPKTSNVSSIKRARSRLKASSALPSDPASSNSLISGKIHSDRMVPVVAVPASPCSTSMPASTRAVTRLTGDCVIRTVFVDGVLRVGAIRICKRRAL